ncbi:MAG: hypothetical protein ACYDDF_09135 [Thermoplasmatota archaeon]
MGPRFYLPICAALLAAGLALMPAHAAPPTYYHVNYVAEPGAAPTAVSPSGIPLGVGGFWLMPDPSGRASTATIQIIDQVNGGGVWAAAEWGSGSGALAGSPTCFQGSTTIPTDPNYGVWVFLQSTGSYTCGAQGNAVAGSITLNYADS